MIIVRSLPVAIEDLSDLSRMPGVDELRPASCPCCGHLAREFGSTLGIVGHGTYRRQVLGLGASQRVVLWVRRYRCRGCGKTISVLPDELVPWRWYAGAAILLTLVGALLLRRTVAELRDTLGPGGRAPHWTTPGRWAKALLGRLFAWKAAELGGLTGIEPAERLRRLLGLVGANARSPDSELAFAARSSIRGTLHTRDCVTHAGHAP